MESGKYIHLGGIHLEGNPIAVVAMDPYLLHEPYNPISPPEYVDPAIPSTSDEDVLYFDSSIPTPFSFDIDVGEELPKEIFDIDQQEKENRIVSQNNNNGDFSAKEFGKLYEKDGQPTEEYHLMEDVSSPIYPYENKNANTPRLNNTEINIDDSFRHRLQEVKVNPGKTHLKKKNEKNVSGNNDTFIIKSKRERKIPSRLKDSYSLQNKSPTDKGKSKIKQSEGGRNISKKKTKAIIKRANSAQEKQAEKYRRMRLLNNISSKKSRENKMKNIAQMASTEKELVEKNEALKQKYAILKKDKEKLLLWYKNHMKICEAL